jgi:hypothetical protein
VRAFVVEESPFKANLVAVNHHLAKIGAHVNTKAA